MYILLLFYLNLQEQVQGEQEFYPKSSSSGDDDDEEEDEEKKKKEQKPVYIMDPDHRLLLRNCKPLLQSRNASVSKTDCGMGSLCRLGLIWIWDPCVIRLVVMWDPCVVAD